MSRVQNLKVFKKCILTYIVIVIYFSRILTLLTLLTSMTNIISIAIFNFNPFYEVWPFSLCSLTWKKFILILISFLVQGLLILLSLVTSLTIISHSNNCFFSFQKDYSPFSLCSLVPLSNIYSNLQFFPFEELLSLLTQITSLTNIINIAIFNFYPF